MRPLCLFLFASTLAAQGLPSISANDNRTTAGALRDGVLTVQLEIRKGNWHPEREDGETFPVYAFGETGKALQDPGPAIRVFQGTTIDITLHNQLKVPATVHGLHERPGDDKNVVTVAAGATQHVRFVAGVPGTYLYWARTPDGLRGANRVADSQLGGALVVDPPGALRDDRIFVLERWNGPTRTAINGKSWPYTERLNYKVGEKVHWKVVNASDLSHPMHLHGFHFELDAEGDGEHYKFYDPSEKPLEFTHNVEIAETFDMTWVPTEPGRWLYHCHRIPHMRLPIPLEGNDVAIAEGVKTMDQDHDHEHMHDMDSDYSGMGGMIMGITITGKSAIDTVTGWKPQRQLELTVGERNGDRRFYELGLRDLMTKTKPQMSTGLTGPVLVVTQGQPTEITVVNKLREPTSIHWHGIEIESYYDGVPGYGGIGDKKAPAVQPGESFTVRMIPPRAGTFMYHTHWHDDAQLTGGVHGTMIVLPPGATYNPATDKSFLFSQSANEPFGGPMLLMNGMPQPATVRLTAGVTYRLRFVNITPSVNNLRVSLRRGGEPVQWKPIAKDAANLKDAPMRLADQLITVGETFDFEYRAAGAEELTLTGLSPNDNRRAVQTLIFSAPRN
jgi:FtsP/CotA-like multicopper oxidase with cupredoxin domain